MIRSTALLVFLLGCTKDPEPPARDDGPDTTTDDTEPPSETGTTPGTIHTGDSASTAETGAPPAVVDCEAVPVAPVSFAPISGARGYHDVIFDDDGNIYGSDGSWDGANLVRSDYYGNWAIHSPGTGAVQGLGRLLDGDFVASTDSGDLLFRFTELGSTSIITGDSGAYGVVVGHDGMVYTANYDAVERIDPVTGARTELYARADFRPRVLNFSVDWSKMYLGTNFGSGDVYAMDMDPVTLDPLGPPYVFATGVGSGDYHDCLAVDYCDNLYVCDYSTNNLYKITPDGTVSIYVDFNSTQYAHGAEWGSGVGGFRLDALYVSQPYNSNTVGEIVIGIPGRDWDGTGWP